MTSIFLLCQNVNFSIKEWLMSVFFFFCMFTNCIEVVCRIIRYILSFRKKKSKLQKYGQVELCKMYSFKSRRRSRSIAIISELLVSVSFLLAKQSIDQSINRLHISLNGIKNFSNPHSFLYLQIWLLDVRSCISIFNLQQFISMVQKCYALEVIA